jgi:hypothetical protein
MLKIDATAKNSPAILMRSTYALAKASLLLMIMLTNACSSAPAQVRALNPVSDFPLSPGSSWTYSYSEYWEEQVQAGQVTVSVVENRMLGDHFLARLTVESSYSAQWTPLGLGQGASEFWYALDEQGRVYFLQDLSQAEDLKDSILAFQFPLDAEECWFRSPDLWNAFGDQCTYTDGPHIIKTPAGSFQDCFLIVTPYLSGNTIDWVCKEVGFAAARYDHLGSPFGYEATLLEYRIAPP